MKDMKKLIKNTSATFSWQIALAGAVMGLLLASTTHATITSGSLIGEWNLNGNLNDGTSNGNDGTLFNGTGSAGFVTDPTHGGGVDLNGTGDRIEFGNSTDFDMTIPFSLEFWGIVDFSGNSIIFGKSATSYGFESSNFKGGSISFVPGTDQWPNNPRSVRQYGSLVHLVGTYDGTTAKIYKNGAEVGGVGTLALGNVAPVATTDPLGVGLANATDATIYHLRIWDNAVTGAEVGTLFADGADNTIVPEPSTIALLALGFGAMIGCRRRRS